MGSYNHHSYGKYHKTSYMPTDLSLPHWLLLHCPPDKSSVHTPQYCFRQGNLGYYTHRLHSLRLLYRKNAPNKASFVPPRHKHLIWVLHHPDLPSTYERVLFYRHLDFLRYLRLSHNNPTLSDDQ